MGTIVNCFAVIAGGSLGLVMKGGLPKRIADLLMQSLGLCTMFIGISGAITAMIRIENNQLVTTQTMLMIASLAIGAVSGELLNIEGRMERLAEKIKLLIKSNDHLFVEGFVTNALVICIGAMAVVGALQDGLVHDSSMLYTKAILDGIISMIFASALGIGVLFAAFPLGIYQGFITVFASFIAPYFDTTLITALSGVGNVLIFGVGINLLFGKQLRVGNLLPSLLIPVIASMVGLL